MYKRNITYSNDKSFFLFGPRGVGKTSWIKSEFKDSLYFDLLDSSVYTSLLASPSRLADLIPSDFAGWVVLDEVQRVPELLNEVHRLIESRGIRFVITGSSARKLRKSGVNLLAGRALTKHMHPLTASELGDDFRLEFSLESGCLPGAYVESDPKAYLKSYVGTYLREEVLQEGLSRNLSAFSRFLETASYSQGSVLNMAAVARDCSVHSKVVADYFSILEDLLIAVRLPVFTRRTKRKLVVHPKFYFFDAGVFSAVRPRGPLDSMQEIHGMSLETLFLQHLRAVNECHDLNYSLSYWLTQSGHEVDFVAYGVHGLSAFEVKHSSNIRGEDFAALKLFGEDYPEAKLYLIYLGTREWQEKGIRIIPAEKALKSLTAILK